MSGEILKVYVATVTTNQGVELFYLKDGDRVSYGRKSGLFSRKSPSYESGTDEPDQQDFVVGVLEKGLMVTVRRRKGQCYMLTDDTGEVDKKINPKRITYWPIDSVWFTDKQSIQIEVRPVSDDS